MSWNLTSLKTAGCPQLPLLLAKHCDKLPRLSGRPFLNSFAAFFGEVAFMLWLVIKGATPPSLDAKG
jgi:hypothetical protein